MLSHHIGVDGESIPAFKKKKSSSEYWYTEMSQKEGERAAAQDNLLSETFNPALPVVSPDLLFSNFSQSSVKDIFVFIRLIFSVFRKTDRGSAPFQRSWLVEYTLYWHTAENFSSGGLDPKKVLTFCFTLILLNRRLVCRLVQLSNLDRSQKG